MRSAFALIRGHSPVAATPSSPGGGRNHGAEFPFDPGVAAGDDREDFKGIGEVSDEPRAHFIRFLFNAPGIFAGEGEFDKVGERGVAEELS